MTYAVSRRYQDSQEYLDDDQLSAERNYRLLSTGELIEVSSEDDINLRLASVVLGVCFSLMNNRALLSRIRNGNKEIQVRPVGDKQVNRKPDLMVMQPEHLEMARQAILLGMTPPLFVAEVVSPGPESRPESSANYQRDYVWKREQYQEWCIPEYWIIDPHRDQVTVLTLVNETYQEKVYQEDSQIESVVFPEFREAAKDVLTGQI
ncbi:Uma2 family endonuclease [Leptolyngbya sp. BC1307]|uniref:Uma2 family endonuclease n=1 Tax=Leptolyngbya sp. BC1307 TaxID=2029589 RepID=UPI000EFCC6ED|nr:Uma2 family endonuclease [Leptolyngbya sp. BC1307]